MRYAIFGVVVGVIGVMIGYALLGSWGALVGAALAPVSTVAVAIIRKPAQVTDFFARVANALLPKNK